MKVSSYIETEDEAAAIADSMNPAMVAERSAFEAKINEVRTNIENKPVRVTDGDLSEGIDFKLGFLAGLKWRGELVEACKERIKL